MKLLTPIIDDRFGAGKITSRIGLQSEAVSISNDDHLLHQIEREQQEEHISCVMVDESQFLTPDQVWQLSEVVDKLGIPVLCFGLRTDAFGKSFPGSETLFLQGKAYLQLKLFGVIYKLLQGRQKHVLPVIDYKVQCLLV